MHFGQTYCSFIRSGCVIELNGMAIDSEVTSKVAIPKDLLAKARHYYGLRNKFIHERATVDVTDRDIKNYRSVVQKMLKLLFDLRL